MLSPQKLSAIAVMAQRGSPQEQTIAKNLLKKAGVTIEQALGGPPAKYVRVKIPYKDVSEREIILQTYAKTINQTEIKYRQESQKAVSMELPPILAKTFQEDCRTLILLWRKEVKQFRKAFVQANGLYPYDPDEIDDNPEDITDLMDILSKAESIATAVLGKLFES